MPRGKPDYHRSTVIEAKHGTDFIPVIVDTAGQMYIALTGQQIQVDQLDSDRVLVGKENSNLHYIAIDTNGVILSRMQGKNGDNGLKDIAVDGSGIMLARMQGKTGEILKDVYVDTAGKMVARVQGVGGGLEPLFTIDDGGDEDLISDWVESEDALDPVDLQDFGKEGQHSMKLGIDADKSVQNYAIWIKTTAIGDMFQYKDLSVYIWIYFNKIDYLQPTDVAFYWEIGTDSSNRNRYTFGKDDLIQGWNLLEVDLTAPDHTYGTINWENISWNKLLLFIIPGATNDFYCVIDLIAVVKPNPVTGDLIDVATDKDGLMLSKMTASYGELHKPITADRFGHLRINISEQGEFTQVSNPYRSGLQNANPTLADKIIGTHTILELTDTRGVIMGGSLRHTATVSHRTCKCLLTIDGVIVSFFSFLTLNSYNAVTPWSHIPHLINYDNTNFDYYVAFPNPIIFHNSVKVELEEDIGGLNATYLHLIYATF